MIWLIVIGLTLLVSAFVFVPLLRKAEKVSGDGEAGLSEARAQLAQLESDHEAGRIGDEVARETRRALELRVLELLNVEHPTQAVAQSDQRVRMIRIIVPVVLCSLGLGLYAQIGRPDFASQIERTETTPPPFAEGESLEDLVVLLQEKLASEDEQPIEGTVLLARSLMTLGRYDEASVAYEKALELSDNLPQIVDEYARASAYIEGVRAPDTSQPVLIDRETLENVQAMSDEDRAAMIEGMVANLAARLEDNPDDAEGWDRLIRARMVMGDVEQAQLDLQRAIEVFETDPETRSRIVGNAVELGLEIPE